MTDIERRIRTGFGILNESSPPAPAFEELTTLAGRSPIWRPFNAAVALALASLVIVATVVVDGGMRLVYAKDPGLDLTYTIHSENTLRGETFVNGGVVRYQLSDAGDGLIDVRITAQPFDDCVECFPAVTVTNTITDQGEIVSIDGDEGVGIPEFAIPNPIPHAVISGGFPQFMGPPFPDHSLRLGETWETNENGIAGQHRLGEQAVLDGRDVVIIDSNYSFTLSMMRPELILFDGRVLNPAGQEITATTRVWFDPAEGVVVQAHLTRSEPWADNTVTIDFQLNG